MSADTLSPDLRMRMSRVRLLSLDVDGVLTDGGLYYAADGTELRRFNVRDGIGIKMTMAAGIAVAFVTTSTTPAIAYRAKMLGVPHCFTGISDKPATLAALAERLGILRDEIAHVADDVNDLPVFAQVGVPIAVADAAPEVLRAAAHVTQRRGGDAAVREVCETLIAARFGRTLK